MNKKPSNITMKNWIIKKMAINLVVSEKIINAVITHQFDSMYGALKDNKTLELYNFGKFYFNTKKAEKELIKLETILVNCERIAADETSSEDAKRGALLKINNLKIDIAYLKSKTIQE